jgi:hypothetical protein
VPVPNNSAVASVIPAVHQHPIPAKATGNGLQFSGLRRVNGRARMPFQHWPYSDPQLQRVSGLLWAMAQVLASASWSGSRQRSAAAFRPPYRRDSAGNDAKTRRLGDQGTWPAAAPRAAAAGLMSMSIAAMPAVAPASPTSRSEPAFNGGGWPPSRGRHWPAPPQGGRRRVFRRQGSAWAGPLMGPERSGGRRRFSVPRARGYSQALTPSRILRKS